MIVNYNVNTRHIKDSFEKKVSSPGIDLSPLLFIVQFPGATLHQQVVSGVNGDPLAGTEEAPYPEPWSCSL